MLQIEVDRLTIDIHSIFDIAETIEYELFLRGGSIFSNVVSASYIVSLQSHLPIYCCAI